MYFSPGSFRCSRGKIITSRPGGPSASIDVARGVRVRISRPRSGQVRDEPAQTLNRTKHRPLILKTCSLRWSARGSQQMSDHLSAGMIKPSAYRTLPLPEATETSDLSTSCIKAVITASGASAAQLAISCADAKVKVPAKRLNRFSTDREAGPQPHASERHTGLSLGLVYLWPAITRRPQLLACNLPLCNLLLDLVDARQKRRQDR
ncbi:hypothetical protein QF002_001706 [Paraburkholderia youngii]